jgi:hypothetical protein
LASAQTSLQKAVKSEQTAGQVSVLLRQSRMPKLEHRIE